MPALRALFLVVVLLLAVGWPVPARAQPTLQPAAAPFVVNWTLDEPDATTLDGLCFSTPSGKCTLRAAVQQANTNSDPNTILLSAGFYVLNRVGVDDTSVAGDLDISGDLTIRGAGMHATTLVVDDTTLHERVLHITSGVVRLEALGLTGGDLEFSGGGIRNAGALTLDHTAVFSNSVFHLGGAAAGGLYNTGQLTLTDTIVEYNAARTTGGGLSNFGIAWIERTTISHNSVFDNTGGGIYNAGTLYLINSTLSSNSSQDGGSGLQNDSTGTTNAYNVTITANIANSDADSSGIDAGVTNNPGGVVNLRNSIVARNFEWVLGLKFYDDCHGLLSIYGNDYFSALGYYLPDPIVSPCTFGFDENDEGQAFIATMTGDLGLLADNGGPTPTHDLAPTSTAYDGADPVAGCIGPYTMLLTDQRGVPRVSGVRCDAGAVEHGSLWHLYTPLVTR